MGTPRPRRTEGLARARAQRGVTLKALAKATGISVATLRRLEAGELTNPGVRYLVNCAQALRVPLSDLILDEWKQWTVFDVDAAAPPKPSELWTRR